MIFYTSTVTNVLTPNWNHLAEMVLMRDHNLHFKHKYGKFSISCLCYPFLSAVQIKLNA